MLEQRTYWLKHPFVKYPVVFILGTGKVISSSALLQQSVQGTLYSFKKFTSDADMILGISIASAVCNGISNAVTRYSSIAEHLFDVPEHPGQGSILFFLYDNDLKWREKIIAWPIKLLGRGSLLFMALNTQNAVQELLYYYLHKENTENQFDWRHQWPIAISAAVINLCSVASYKAFNLPRIDRNAESFAKFISKNMFKKIRALSPWILWPLVGMTLLNIPPNLGNNYYPTKKALTNFFGATEMNSWYLETLLYGSLLCGFSSNIFSMIGESFRFLTDNHKGQRIKQWFQQNLLTTLLIIVLIVPILGDMAANTFGNYVGDAELFSHFIHTQDNLYQLIFGIASATIYGIFYTLYQEVPIFEVIAGTKSLPPSKSTTDFLISSPSQIAIDRQNNQDIEQAVNSQPSACAIQTSQPQAIQDNSCQNRLSVTESTPLLNTPFACHSTKIKIDDKGTLRRNSAVCFFASTSPKTSPLSQKRICISQSPPISRK